MTARIWNTQQLKQVCIIAAKGGYEVKRTSETCKVQTPDGEHIVLTALKMRMKVWMVRYDETVFAE